jgi:hypothetical protein
MKNFRIMFGMAVITRTPALNGRGILARKIPSVIPEALRHQRRAQITADEVALIQRDARYFWI